MNYNHMSSAQNKYVSKKVDEVKSNDRSAIDYVSAMKAVQKMKTLIGS